MLNYARMTPVYIAQMFQLKQKDQLTWLTLESGHFSVNKSCVPFSAIRADHGIEQKKRFNKNIEKISAVFSIHKVSFESSDIMYNVLTKKVLPNDTGTIFLAVKSIGQDKYDNFVRLKGSWSKWDPLKKEKFTVNKQLVQVREERKLMSRLLVASRSRPDIILPNNIGTYKFSVGTYIFVCCRWYFISNNRQIGNYQ